MVDRFLACLLELMQANNDYRASKLSLDDFNSARKKFAAVLNDCIDFRVDGVLEERKKRLSSSGAFEVAALLTTGADIDKNSIVALNSAPLPPPNIEEWARNGDIKKWMHNYIEWYYTHRKDGLG